MSERYLYFSHAALVMVCYNSYIRILRDKKKSAYTLTVFIVIITNFTTSGCYQFFKQYISVLHSDIISYIRLLFPFLPVFFFRVKKKENPPKGTFILM